MLRARRANRKQVVRWRAQGVRALVADNVEEIASRVRAVSTPYELTTRVRRDVPKRQIP
jgi:hypothetical protein